MKALMYPRIASVAGVLVFVLSSSLLAQAPASQPSPKRIALLANVFNAKAHANVLATKFFTGFPTDDGLIPPQIKIVSMYIDQDSPDAVDLATKGAWDVGKKLAAKHDVKIYPTVEGALTLGTGKLAVDGVIYIGEHGDYPNSRLGVKMYPRLHILEQVFRVFDASKKSVPLYSDKHLAYSWLDSKWIYDRAKELNVPMMAGSSLPMSWRDPVIEHPLGTKITEAVAIGYGTIESYGIHVAETLQCMVERRAGGETGVASVQCLKGKAVWDAADAGKFSIELAQAACDAIKYTGIGKSKAPTKSMRDAEPSPVAVLITYRDGTKGTILMLGRYIGEHWAYAAKADGKVQACEVILEHDVYSHFSYLGLNIQQMMVTGKPSYPIERTLLTSGMVDMAIRSNADGGKVIATPFLDVSYTMDGYNMIKPKSPRPIGQSVGPWPPAGYEYIVWSEKPAGDGKSTSQPAGKPAGAGKAAKKAAIKG